MAKEPTAEMSGRPTRQYTADINAFLNAESGEEVLSRLEQKCRLRADPRKWEERLAEEPDVEMAFRAR